MKTNESLELIDYVLSNDNQLTKELSELCFLFHILCKESCGLDMLFAQKYIHEHYAFKLEIGIELKDKIDIIYKKYNELIKKYPFMHYMYINKLNKLYSYDVVLNWYKEKLKFPLNEDMIKKIVNHFFVEFKIFKMKL